MASTSFQGFRSEEQRTYAWNISMSIDPGPPLLAGAAPGLGKTHGYSVPLVRSCLSGRRVAITFPTRQLIEQYLQSQALRDALIGADVRVMSLRPRHDFATDEAYEDHRQQAHQAQVLLLTHAAAIMDGHWPGYACLRTRDVVLFDEADLLADAADLRSTFSIDAQTLANLRVSRADPELAAKTVLASSGKPEVMVAANMILRALERPRWYKRVGWQDNGSLTLKHRMPGRMLRRLLQDIPRTIFTSGTMLVNGRFDHFRKALGLASIDLASFHIEPSSHGRLQVEVARQTLSPQQKAQRIAQAERPVLVITTSHADSMELVHHLKDQPGVVVRNHDNSMADVIQSCPDDGIMVCAAAWSGLDLPGLRWKTVVLYKAPYGQPVKLDARAIGSYADSAVAAVRRTNQSLHRGLRTPDANCTFLMLDPRSARPLLRQAIPSRFAVNWGDRDTVPLIGQPERAERLHRPVAAHVTKNVTASIEVDAAAGTPPAWRRSPLESNISARAMALAHHGSQCQWPGCDVTAAQKLQIHDTRLTDDGPITMEQIQVLCAAHHAFIHAHPPGTDFALPFEKNNVHNQGVG